MQTKATAKLPPAASAPTMQSGSRAEPNTDDFMIE